jgi:hypothetical protein
MWHFILCQERNSGINTKVKLLWHPFKLTKLFKGLLLDSVGVEARNLEVLSSGKVDQMAIEYTYTFRHKTLQNLPKLGLEIYASSGSHVSTVSSKRLFNVNRWLDQRSIRKQ